MSYIFIYLLIGAALYIVVDVFEHQTMHSTLRENYIRRINKWVDEGKIIILDQQHVAIPLFNIEVRAYVWWKSVEIKYGLYRIPGLIGFLILWPFILAAAVYLLYYNKRQK